MARALRLAALGRHASPNPMVGCVLIDPSTGAKVGEGWHREPGEAHAEVRALRAAGMAARGATAVVTLEPCSHFGRTPPCADALIDAGVARVVVAMLDPDRRVAGRGVDRLRGAGVDVTVGVLADRAAKLNAAYIKHRTTGLPWVVLKSAVTLDGKVATVTGDSKWITSPISRTAAHRQLRDRCDAVMAGVGTVLADDPALTTRLSRGGRNPWRVIVDSRGRTPLTSAVVRKAADDRRTLIATTAAMPPPLQETFLDAGCQMLVCEAGVDGRVDLLDLMRRLGSRGDMVGVLVEGGPELSGSLMSAGVVDRWLLAIAPRIAGGSAAPGPIGGAGVCLMSDALRPESYCLRRSGTDVIIDVMFG